MKAYLDILRNIIENGIEKSPTRRNPTTNEVEVVDGGVKTIGLPNLVFSHDMRTGFPLVTCRKMPFKSMSVELEGFIRGVTDKSWYKNRGCNYWNAWKSPIHKNFLDNYTEKKFAEEDNDLGPIGYAHGWRNLGGMYQPIPTIHTNFDKEIKINRSANSKHIGQSFENKYGKFTVIDSIRKNKQTYYKIKFHVSGYENYVNGTNLSHKEVKDPYFPNIYNVACIGEDKITNYKIYSIWNNIISRCYNKNAKDYKRYGEQGVYVDNKWLIFSNFQKDFINIEGYDLKKNNWRQYTIDKDTGGGNCYSLENCKFLSSKEQCLLRKNRFFYKGISPNGQEFTFNNAVEFAKQHKLDSTTISRVCNKHKDYSQHLGWKFEKIGVIKQDNNKKGFDQLGSIVDKLLNSPSDRRMNCTAWSEQTVKYGALPPCHLNWCVTVYGDTLNLMYIMRSCDMIRGTNISTYGLLLELLAATAGLTPGNLTGVFVDAHIYDRDIESAKELIKREPRTLPNIRFTNNSGQLKEKFNIFDWTYQDVELLNYNPHEAMKFAPVVV